MYRLTWVENNFLLVNSHSDSLKGPGWSYTSEEKKLFCKTWRCFHLFVRPHINVSPDDMLMLINTDHWPKWLVCWFTLVSSKQEINHTCYVLYVQVSMWTSFRVSQPDSCLRKQWQNRSGKTSVLGQMVPRSAVVSLEKLAVHGHSQVLYYSLCVCVCGGGYTVTG